jgi:ABC-type multidrug transport system fused ATPase/permease subunit
MRASLRGFRVLMAFSFRAAPREATLFLLAGAVMSLVMPVAALGSKLLVDGVLAGSFERAMVAALLLAAAAGLGVLNTLYYVDLLFSVAEKAGAAVDRRLIELVSEVPGLAHHERPEYLDKLDLLREQRASLGWMTNATAGIVRVAVQLSASGILLARLSPILLLLPLAGVVSFLAGRRAQNLQQRALEATVQAERLRRHLFDTAMSAGAGKEVRVFRLQDELDARHHFAAGEMIAKRDRAGWQAAGWQSVDALVSGLAYAGAIALVLVRAIDGEATPGDVVLAVGLAAGMNMLVTIAVFYGTSFLRVLRVAERFLWLEDYADAARVTPADPAPVPARLTHGIELRDVSFRYPGTERTVLDAVSLRLPAGSVVALVGENGAGKTSMVKLLARFYEPDQGQVSIDGVDLQHFQVEAWRRRISAGFQDFARFELLARETVAVGDLPRFDDDKAVALALTRAGGRDVPERLPRGLETQLGKDWEGGVDLSGGQWQKLALARAMMRERPLLLILDEPTASLDAQTEHELFERYASAARESGPETGAIVILVSHRFSTVRMADLIVVLEGGAIREVGNHDQLMAAGGTYAELYELQARGYR